MEVKLVPEELNQLPGFFRKRTCSSSFDHGMMPGASNDGTAGTQHCLTNLVKSSSVFAYICALHICAYIYANHI